LAACLGALLGGFVPLSTFVVAHQEVSRVQPLYEQWVTLLVGGGLLFSATTVYAWCKQAFQSSVKAFGFVLLVEGTMVISQVQWLSVAALVYLIAINGVATGCQLTRKPKPSWL